MILSPPEQEGSSEKVREGRFLVVLGTDSVDSENQVPRPQKQSARCETSNPKHTYLPPRRPGDSVDSIRPSSGGTGHRR